MADRIAFSFGKNWQDYLDQALNPARIETATAQTKQGLELDSFAGLTFLDIGCGSGLFSYAAHTLGAAQVTSLDVDPHSVECCRQLRARLHDPPNWTIRQGSILDPDTVASLPTADIVYAWGVLHHTGDMWQAIRNAAELVQPGGRFLIAIYNRLEYDSLTKYRGSHGWLRVKRAYNRSGWLGRRCIEWWLAGKDIAKYLLTFRNPFREIRRYGEKRGMSWWYDVVDWVGGYPYEFASAGEVFNFCHREFGFELRRLRSTSAIGCNEFLFVRAPDPVIGGVRGRVAAVTAPCAANGPARG